MKPPSRIAFVVFVFSFTVNSGWAQWVSRPSPTSEFVTKVAFYNSSTGWIMTGTDSRVDSTFIWKTVDSGKTWILQHGSKGSSYAMAVIDSLTIVYSASGGEGIWRTSNSGSTWTLVSDSAIDCFDISFPSPSVGYAVGGNTSGIVRKTTDSGQTWFTAANISSASEFSAVSFLSSTAGFAVTFYPGKLYSTTDGGYNWAFVDSVGYGDQIYQAPLPVRDMQFVSPDSGWVIGGLSGSSFVARTIDGGSSWQYSRFSVPSTTFQALQMLDAMRGWIVGYDGPNPILRTTDAGSSWQAQMVVPSTIHGFKSIFMIDTLIGYAVGQQSVYTTVTGGGMISSVSLPDLVSPTKFVLNQNYPNPFNSMTHISFSLSSGGTVQLLVTDILGRTVAELEKNFLAPGLQQFSFDASRHASGVYFYSLIKGSSTETKKMILLR